MSKKKNKRAGCEYCSYCVPIGEGDHICDAEDMPKLVMSDYEPTEDYLCCNGRKFEN